MSEREKKRPTLADRFIARKFAERERAVHPKALDQLKAGVRNARRFTFTEDAVNRVADIIIDIPDLLMREHRFARAPYDLTWIEFPAYVLWERFRSLDPQLYEKRGKWGDPEYADHTVGYLIDHERVNVICAGTVGDPDELCNVLPLQFRLHTEWPAAERAEFARRTGIRSDLAAREQLITDDDQIEMYLWGSTYMRVGQLTRLALAERNVAEFLPPNPQHKNFDLWTADGQMIDCVKGSIGELRNIIAFLLVMNRPSLTKYVHTAQNGRGFYRGKSLAYMRHTTVTIDLDARPTLRLIGTAAEGGVPKRRHETKGHYKHDAVSREYSRIAGCIHEYEPTHGPADKWAPWPDAPIGTPGEPGVPRNWVCACCGGKRWWQRDYESGTAEVGFVAHDAYEVTTGTAP